VLFLKIIVGKTRAIKIKTGFSVYDFNAVVVGIGGFYFVFFYVVYEIIQKIIVSEGYSPKSITKKSRLKAACKIGCLTWIRTTINRVRVCCPTIRR
jgi:hypothetical protein